ncbi:MAG: lipid droplet-associated protein [Sciscionella sp.]
MKPLPLPLRVAAGLVATAAEKARELPNTVAGLPVTVASQALQLSMRVQQQVTELAIRGDSVLSVLRPVEETPEWATFDEDAVDSYSRSTPARMNGLSAWDAADLEPAGAYYGGADDEADEAADADDDPWQREERALAAKHTKGEFDTSEPDRDEPEASEPSGPESFPDYPGLTIAQLRGRLRTFDLAALRELLDYERGHANREEFTAMLSRRIDAVRAKR